MLLINLQRILLLCDHILSAFGEVSVKHGEEKCVTKTQRCYTNTCASLVYSYNSLGQCDTINCTTIISLRVKLVSLL